MLIQQGKFKHSIEQLDRELSLYQWDDDGLIQDCVMAAALGAHTVSPPHVRLSRAFDKASAKPPAALTPQQQMRRMAINSPEYVEPKPARSRLANGW
jgi:hypothetical protein